MILEIVAVVYVAVAIFVFGFGVGDEMGFVNPEYWKVAKIALLWPFFLLYGLLIRLDGRRDG
jgi:hypothetical protein